MNCKVLIINKKNKLVINRIGEVPTLKDTKEKKTSIILKSPEHFTNLQEIYNSFKKDCETKYGAIAYLTQSHYEFLQGVAHD